MEVICLPGSKDTVIFKAVQSELPKDCKLAEAYPTDKTITKKDFLFTKWPVLLVNDQPVVYGMRAVLNYLFTNTKLLPQKDASNIETLFVLADSLYSSICPIVAHNQSCIVKEEILAKAEKTTKEVLATITKYFTGNNTIADIYANSMIAVAAAMGIDVSPIPVQKFEILESFENSHVFLRKKGELRQIALMRKETRNEY